MPTFTPTPTPSLSLDLSISQNPNRSVFLTFSQSIRRTLFRSPPTAPVSFNSTRFGVSDTCLKAKLYCDQLRVPEISCSHPNRLATVICGLGLIWTSTNTPSHLQGKQSPSQSVLLFPISLIS